MVTKNFDRAVADFSRVAHLCAGWKAFTPPGHTREWYAAVGYTLEGSIHRANDTAGRGVAVNFYAGKQPHWELEGWPLDRAGWQPPHEFMAHVNPTDTVRRWTERYMKTDDWANDARAAHIRQLCDGFRSRMSQRHGGDEDIHGLKSVEVWFILRRVAINWDGTCSQQAPNEEQAGGRWYASSGTPVIGEEHLLWHGAPWSSTQTPLLRGHC